jgi:hypothetical protein
MNSREYIHSRNYGVGSTSDGEQFGVSVILVVPCGSKTLVK